MKIKKIKIKNFRGYKEETDIQLDDFSVFVGKNDIGKSTVLECLDIFFYEGKGTIRLDKEDVNIDARANGDDVIQITVCFTELPENIILDSNYRTSLEEEFLLNTDGDLEVIKRFPNAGAPKVYIRAQHPTNPICSELLLKTNSQLKKIINQNGVDCENLTINSCMRKAIWDTYQEDLQLELVDVDANSADGKKIWTRLSTFMPIYSLFQSDRKNSDGDSEIQDPLKIAVKQILSDAELQSMLGHVAEEVQSKLQIVADRTLDKIREMDPTIANSLNPVIPISTELKWSDVFKNVSITGDEGIPINKRGSGIKRLVLLNFFRAEAERRLVEGDHSGVIYAIEEPETSQHEDSQRTLVEALKRLSELENVQVILTTHSDFIVKQLDFENICLIKRNETTGVKEINNIEPEQLPYPSLNEVNYTAFKVISEGYHNELYGYIELQGWKTEYFEGKPTRLYRRLNNDGTIREEQKVLDEYIRNLIHHPENRNNARYTEEELKTSIEDMREYIKTKMESRDFELAE